LVSHSSFMYDGSTASGMRSAVQTVVPFAAVRK